MRTLTGDLTVDNTDRFQHALDQAVGEAEGLVAVDLADFTLSVSVQWAAQGRGGGILGQGGVEFAGAQEGCCEVS
ncbi:hypothetical protein [Kitasatospora sp. NPDC005748]|uniref:hypothetical protein n=1 Tax=Kitasatospora sp. NPDC005748 TaxID=3157063 RepID=UPI00340DFD7B